MYLRLWSKSCTCQSTLAQSSPRILHHTMGSRFETALSTSLALAESTETPACSTRPSAPRLLTLHTTTWSTIHYRLSSALLLFLAQMLRLSSFSSTRRSISSSFRLFFFFAYSGRLWQCWFWAFEGAGIFRALFQGVSFCPFPSTFCHWGLYLHL